MTMAGSATADFDVVPDDRATRPLVEAERVQRELEALVARLVAMGPGHPHHVHVLFAELYLCDTVSWLAHLKQTPRAEHAYRVIARFHELYREHVLDRVDRPLHEIAPHWRAYHRLARRLTIRSPISAHLLLLCLGARAHVRFDLGRAIRETGVADDMDALFGQVSDVAFVQATCAFVELHRARQAGWRRLVLVLYGRGLVLLKPVWLSELQRWRRASYRDGRQVFPTVTVGGGSNLLRTSRLLTASPISQTLHRQHASRNWRPGP